jgi:cell division transport system ATP-binding protein
LETVTLPKPAIDARNAQIVQQKLEPVLEQVSFRVMPGEFVYLTGKTGTGKTSLLKSLYAELPVFNGDIFVNDTPLRGINRNHIPHLRRKIGMVFQDFRLMDRLSAYENLDFVLRATDWKNKDERHHRIVEVLEELSLENKADRLPYQLSGGEQQRLAIARAILNRPPVILADEPTGNLDPDIADEIIGLLHYLSEKGAAVVMATHDYRLINKFPGTLYELKDQHMSEKSFIV